MDPVELDHRFTFHPANETEVAECHDDVRLGCKALARTLNDLLPEGREKSLAMTNLEQCMFWANAAVARDAAKG